MFMKAPIFKSTRAQANFHPEKTFLYTFDYRGEHSYADVYDFSNPLFRDFVQHGDELIYTLAHPPYAKDLNADDTKFAEMLVDLWTSFAQTGVPKSDRAPQWPPMTSTQMSDETIASVLFMNIFLLYRLQWTIFSYRQTMLGGREFYGRTVCRVS